MDMQELRTPKLPRSLEEIREVLRGGKPPQLPWWTQDQLPGVATTPTCAQLHVGEVVEEDVEERRRYQ